MSITILWRQGLLVLAGLCAGAINAVAGGGTLLTFPSLLAAGLSPISANATSTLALVPGSAAALWGYREEVRDSRRALVALVLPSVVGGVIGATLVLGVGDAAFRRIVPWLILAATVLFFIQERVASAVRRAADAGAGRRAHHLWFLAAMQLIVSVYGGFFGAGMGILMLAAMGIAGMSGIHRMNGLKSAAAICINGVAALAFVVGRRVNWNLALLVALAAIAGGLGGARLARRLGERNVRRAVMLIGLTIGLVLLVRR